MVRAREPRDAVLGEGRRVNRLQFPDPGQGYSGRTLDRAMRGVIMLIIQCINTEYYSALRGIRPIPRYSASVEGRPGP